MASFNPQVQPQNAPDWTNVTKPVSPLDADKSKGITLSTIGTGIEEGTKLAESTAEDYLKEKVSAGVDALRDTSLLAYQNIRDSQTSGQPLDPAALKTAGFDGSLLKGGNTNIPQDLQAGLDRAENIGLAKSQRGAANDTLYTSQLYALTKQLRSEYPGHKDFIDQQISRISGKNPANAYMDNLLYDINRASTGQDTFQKQILAGAKENMGDPAVQKWWLAAQHGVPNAMQGLTSAVFQAETQKWQHNNWKVKSDETKGDQAADADIAAGQAEIRAQQTVDKHLEPVVQIPGLTNTQTMRKLVDDSAAGKLSLTPTQKDQLVQSLQMARSHAADDLQSTFDKEGYSTRVRDPGKLQAIRDSKLAYFDRSIALINDEKFGSFFEERRRNLADQDVTNRQINTSKIGEWTRQRSRMNEALGPNWMNYLDSIGMPKGNLKELQSFFNDTQYRASVSDDIRKDGVVGSMYSDLAAAKKAKAEGANVPDKIYDDVVDNIKLLQKATSDGKQDVAKQIVKYTFDPAKNQRTVEFFGRDFTDDKNVLHKGRFAMYDTLTQPKTVDAVWNLKDPASWQMHKDWQEISFKTLFGGEVQELNKIQTDRSLPFKIKYDSDSSRIIPEFGVKATTPVEARYIQSVNETVNNLNRGLNNLNYMYRKEGGDANSHVFQTLMDLGYSPNDKLHGDNLPQKVIDAIAASSKTNKNRIEDAFSAARGN